MNLEERSHVVQVHFTQHWWQWLPQPRKVRPGYLCLHSQERPQTVCNKKVKLNCSEWLPEMERQIPPDVQFSCHTVVLLDSVLLWSHLERRKQWEDVVAGSKSLGRDLSLILSASIPTITAWCCPQAPTSGSASPALRGRGVLRQASWVAPLKQTEITKSSFVIVSFCPCTKMACRPFSSQPASSARPLPLGPASWPFLLPSSPFCYSRGRIQGATPAPVIKHLCSVLWLLWWSRSWL